VNGQLHVPVALPTPPVRIGYKAGCCGEEKNFLALQLVAHLYTDLATLAADINCLQMYLSLSHNHSSNFENDLAKHSAWRQCALYFVMLKGGWHVESFIKIYQWDKDGILKEHLQVQLCLCICPGSWVVKILNCQH
jgi:hypothetical protein